MTKNPAKKVWIILDHPWQMLLAMAIHLGSPSSLRYGLLISRHKYWSVMNIDKYRPYFEEIFFFPEPQRANSIISAIKFAAQSQRLKKEVKRLPIKPADALLTLSYVKYAENIITTLFNKNRQIFLCRDDMYKAIYRSRQEVSKTSEFHITKSGYIHYFLLEPLLRLKKRTLFYWIKSREQTHDISYSQPVEKLYDQVLIFRSVFHITALKNNEIYNPSLLLRSLSRPAGQKRVVFFLSGYIRNSDYYAKINRLLKILKNRYDKEFLLEIRVHPNFPNEPQKIDYDGWQINMEPGNAEEFLIRHADEIVLAVSHLSTTLLFASQIGIQANTYYRCFGFETAFTDIYDRIYADMPKEFFMTSFEQIPEKYALPVKEEQIRLSLNKLYEVLTG